MLVFSTSFIQKRSLQQYAKIPRGMPHGIHTVDSQKHAGGYEERTSKFKRTLFPRKV